MHWCSYRKFLSFFPFWPPQNQSRSFLFNRLLGHHKRHNYVAYHHSIYALIWYCVDSLPENVLFFSSFWRKKKKKMVNMVNVNPSIGFHALKWHNYVTYHILHLCCDEILHNKTCYVTFLRTGAPRHVCYMLFCQLFFFAWRLLEQLRSTLKANMKLLAILFLFSLYLTKTNWLWSKNGNAINTIWTTS